MVNGQENPWRKNGIPMSFTPVLSWLSYYQLVTEVISVLRNFLENWGGGRRIPWKALLKGRGVQESWTLLKDELLTAQEHAVPMCWKMSQKGRRTAWLNRDLWLELGKKRKEKNIYEMWKKERTTQEDYKEVTRLCREKIRSTKAQA